MVFGRRILSEQNGGAAIIASRSAKLRQIGDLEYDSSPRQANARVVSFSGSAPNLCDLPRSSLLAKGFRHDQDRPKTNFDAAALQNDHIVIGVASNAEGSAF